MMISRRDTKSRERDRPGRMAAVIKLWADQSQGPRARGDERRSDTGRLGLRAQRWAGGRERGLRAPGA